MSLTYEIGDLVVRANGDRGVLRTGGSNYYIEWELTGARWFVGPKEFAMWVAKDRLFLNAEGIRGVL